MAKGLTRAIGISNFSITKTEALLKTAKIVPAVNQVECHPYFQQPKLREYCSRKGHTSTRHTLLSSLPSLSFSHITYFLSFPFTHTHTHTHTHCIAGIVFQAYSPLGNPGNPFAKHPHILEDTTVKEIATKHNIMPAQVNCKNVDVLLARV